MKKVVVVTKDEQVLLEGNTLKVINPSKVGGYGSDILVVMDGQAEIAVFHDWFYWKKLE